jgi:hypothetical protein
MRHGRNILLVGLLVALLACPEAIAAGGYRAHAAPPAYDSSALELVGKGFYRSRAKRRVLRVTVCLRKRIGRRFFDVRCSPPATAERARRVSAEVTVPGCVRGLWRTTVLGEALDRNGNLVNQTNAVSRPFRC